MYLLHVERIVNITPVEAKKEDQKESLEIPEMWTIDVTVLLGTKKC